MFPDDFVIPVPDRTYQRGHVLNGPFHGATRQRIIENGPVELTAFRIPDFLKLLPKSLPPLRTCCW